MTAVNPFFQLPATDVTQQYRMGASFIPQPEDIYWNVTDPDGTVLVCSEPPAWEGLTYVTPIDTVGGRDGGLTGPPSIAPRQLDMSAMIIGATPQLLRQKLAAIRRMLGPRKTVIWEQYDWGTGLTLAMETVATGSFAPDPPYGYQLGGEACTLAFSLLAGTPWKYVSGGAPESLFLNMPADTVSGYTFNYTFPYNFGATVNPGGSGIANNQGDIPAYPVFIITGPINTPMISNDTTGQSFYVNANVPSGVTIVIDSATGVVTPSQYRLLGDPWTLQPGANAVRWRQVTGSFNPAASLTLQWRSTLE